MIGVPYDPYYALLDDATFHEIEDIGRVFAHASPSFDQSVYERSRGIRFESSQAAYADWLDFGRRNGLEYAHGKDTVLKIALKAKDEPQLLDAWIEHHSRIVGLHNIIILDTGSTDPEHWAVLERFRGKILVFHYRKHYNTIHFPSQNRELYELISANCQYFAVLDADEFLALRAGDRISANEIGQFLHRSRSRVHAGTWIFNSEAPSEGALRSRTEVAFTTSPQQLRNGTIAGKAIVSSRALFAAQHVGHNMHVDEVIDLMDSGSTGSIVVLHVQKLSRASTRARARAHLISSGVISVDLTDDSARLAVEAAVEHGDLTSRELRYARQFLEGHAGDDDTCSFTTGTVSFAVSLDALFGGINIPGLDAAYTAAGLDCLREARANKVDAAPQTSPMEEIQMPNSVVDFVSLPHVRGWVEIDSPASVSLVLQTEGDAIELEVNSWTRRSDFQTRTVFGFDVAVPKGVSYDDLDTERVRFFCVVNGNSAQIPIWGPVATFVKYSSLPRDERVAFLRRLSRHNPEVLLAWASSNETGALPSPGTVSADGSAIVGKNGDFFVFQGRNSLARAYDVDADSRVVDSWSALVRRRREEAERLRVEYRQVFIPEKSSVLPESSPLGNSGPTALWKRVLRSAADAAPSNVIDCGALIFDALQRDTWFRRYDSHFSTLGAMEVVRKIVESLGKNPTLLGAADFQTVLAAGDLAGKFPEFSDFPELVTLAGSASWDGASLDEPVLIECFDPPGGHAGSIRHWRSTSAPFGERAICFGNSFFERGAMSNGLSWWFARLFSEFRFEWRSDADWELCSDRAFDVVIAQTVERFLGSIPPR